MRCMMSTRTICLQPGGIDPRTIEVVEISPPLKQNPWGITVNSTSTNSGDPPRSEELIWASAAFSWGRSQSGITPS